MLNSLLLAAAMWPSSVTQNCTPSESSIIVGVAQSHAGEHLYCELISRTSEGSFDISYILKDEVFAEKKINYNTHSTMPSVDQQDFRFGEARKANVLDTTIELQYQPNKQKKMGSMKIPIQEVDIVDAGFDNYIRDHWEELQAGKTLSVSFASMAHLRALPLRVTAQPLEKCTTKNEKKSQLFCFFVEIDNAILRMLLGNIKLTYDQQHRLHEFNGIVNLVNNDEKNQKAVIRYFYTEDYSRLEK